MGTLSDRLPRLSLEFFVNLGLELTDTISRHFPQGVPKDRLHIFVRTETGAAATISPSTSNESNAGSSANDSHLLARLRKLHTHLWGENRIVRRGEMACSILDLALFGVLNLNIRPDKILLIRDEYVFAYDDILQDTLKISTTDGQRSATLVTGQPGIGKSLFLFYVLARRLHDKSPVAFQIDEHNFVLFDQDGVTLHSTTDSQVPEGTWALSDSDASSRRGLCMAFQQPAFHVIYTSSPSHRRWKNWVKRLGARKYIMDVWSLEELQTLLALHNLDFPEGKVLFEKYGPSPRIIIYILIKKTKEDDYQAEVEQAAATLANEFPIVFPRLESLDFGADETSSKIFTVRPNTTSRGKHALSIQTPFLCRIFGLAMAHQAAAQQHTFFRMLSSHPTFRDAAGWLFEHYAHNRLSEPTRESLKAHSRDGKAHDIPVPAKIIAGSTALARIQPPCDFYWRPVKPNFKGVDAIIRDGNDVWALQYSISAKHIAATDGLIEIREGMNHKRNVKWHLVMIGSDLTNAMELRDHQELGDDWKWSTQVYASELPLGQFNELHAQRLETILENADDTVLVPDQEGDGNSMDESL
ncbi:hypothetical protein F5887DRAFT_971403 [Amanita rubescens]|nr:hypothetical protein F5887DRAFT_971403 [Amanita rubescens]